MIYLFAALFFLAWILIFKFIILPKARTYRYWSGITAQVDAFDT